MLFKNLPCGAAIASHLFTKEGHITKSILYRIRIALPLEKWSWRGFYRFKPLKLRLTLRHKKSALRRFFRYTN